MAIVDTDEVFLRQLFEKTVLAMRADGTGDNLINLELHEDECTFMLAGDSETALDKVLISPAPFDQEYLPRGGAVDNDGDLANDEEILPLQVPPGFVIVAATDASLVKKRVLLLGRLGWLKGFIMPCANSKGAKVIILTMVATCVETGTARILSDSDSGRSDDSAGSESDGYSIEGQEKAGVCVGYPRVVGGGGGGTKRFTERGYVGIICVQERPGSHAWRAHD